MPTGRPRDPGGQPLAGRGGEANARQGNGVCAEGAYLTPLIMLSCAPAAEKHNKHPEKQETKTRSPRPRTLVIRRSSSRGFLPRVCSEQNGIVWCIVIFKPLFTYDITDSFLY